MATKLQEPETSKPADTLHIPSFTGAQIVTTRYQRRTQLQYLLAVGIGLATFYTAENPRLRTAGLGCLFPGAGFLAVGGILGALGLVLSLATLPICLFAWFGAGGFAFVIGNWLFSGLIATWMAYAGVWELSAPIAVILVVCLSGYAFYKAYVRSQRALKLRQTRNDSLDEAEREWKSRAVHRSMEPAARQLSITEAKLLQRFVELAMQEFDDWSNFNVIDQFQTSALRYQMYDIQYTLALVQKYYMPSFHGYVKTAQERLIERSTTKDVMGYWKWESLWGKFTLNWDPVLRDNIMVTGYLLLCLSLYEKLNGDRRYVANDALNFCITSKKTYLHGTHSIFRALMENWSRCAYCLFPCEPNWIYSGCNLVGMQGAVAYDAIEKTGTVGALLRTRWHRQFEEEFMNPDGSIVALRSAITGFPIVGLAGVIGDVGGALTCTASMPSLARRLWHVSRESNVRKTDKGRYTLEGLVGADNMDVGSYKAGPSFSYSMYACCAGEFGEMDLKADLLDELNDAIEPVKVANETTGSLQQGAMSVLGSGFAFRARLLQRDDWQNLIRSPVDKATISGPKLAHVKFPEVMVLSCHLIEKGRDLQFGLLAKSMDDQTFGFKDLQPSSAYILISENEEKHFKSDKLGELTITVRFAGKRKFVLTPGRSE